jgi:hypothetical protein
MPMCRSVRRVTPHWSKLRVSFQPRTDFADSLDRARDPIARRHRHMHGRARDEDVAGLERLAELREQGRGVAHRLGVVPEEPALAAELAVEGQGRAPPARRDGRTASTSSMPRPIFQPTRRAPPASLPRQSSSCAARPRARGDRDRPRANEDTQLCYRDPPPSTSTGSARWRGAVPSAFRIGAAEYCAT